MRERVRQRSQGQTGAVSVKALWQAEGRDCCRNSQKATEAGAERARRGVSQGHGRGEPAALARTPASKSGFQPRPSEGSGRAGLLSEQEVPGCRVELKHKPALLGVVVVVGWPPAVI